MSLNWKKFVDLTVWNQAVPDQILAKNSDNHAVITDDGTKGGNIKEILDSLVFLKKNIYGYSANENGDVKVPSTFFDIAVSKHQERQEEEKQELVENIHKQAIECLSELEDWLTTAISNGLTEPKGYQFRQFHTEEGGFPGLLHDWLGEKTGERSPMPDRSDITQYPIFHNMFTTLKGAIDAFHFNEDDINELIYDAFSIKYKSSISGIVTKEDVEGGFPEPVQIRILNSLLDHIKGVEYSDPDELGGGRVRKVLHKKKRRSSINTRKSTRRRRGRSARKNTRKKTRKKRVRSKSARRQRRRTLRR